MKSEFQKILEAEIQEQAELVKRCEQAAKEEFTPAQLAFLDKLAAAKQKLQLMLEMFENVKK